MTALIARGADPFGDAAPRTRYFETDAHYRRVAADLRALFARRSGLIFVTADPAPDGARLKARLVEGGPMRAGVARAEPGISFSRPTSGKNSRCSGGRRARCACALLPVRSFTRRVPASHIQYRR
jgi:hypothetical protein